MRVAALHWGLCLSALLSSLSGCEEGVKYAAFERTTSSAPSAAATPAPSPPIATGNVLGEKIPDALPRKIIYNAQVTLVVESVTQVAEEITRLVKESGGYVAETNLSSYTKVRREATWKVRVPVERFETFLASVGKLGELQQNHVDSQDVTQEYYDLEARIKNKQQEEKRLLKHLDESTGKLHEILEVEREINRVRGEVEQMQGRIRYLTNVSALSTITISASELKDYTPPISPTFTTQIGRTFANSLADLTAFGKALVLFIVALAPWLPLIVLAALLALWLMRRVWRTFRRARTA